VLYFPENISSLAAKSSKFYQEHRVFHTPPSSVAAGTILPRPIGDHKTPKAGQERWPERATGGTVLKIYNSLTRGKQEFVPIEAGKVRMYVCGMTVYDYCHLGHARVMVVFDVVRRWLRASGFDVTYVRNITDIDDKIIKRAQENREPIETLTARFIEAMDEDAAALGAEKPDFEPRATQHVQGMLDMIKVLEARGLAYQAANGDVVYSVRKFEAYGKLSGKTLDDLRAGASSRG